MEEGATNKDKDLEEILVVLVGYWSMALRILFNGVYGIIIVLSN